MNRVVAATCVSIALLGAACAACADGGYFPPIIGSAADLAQTQQEVLLVIQRDAPDSPTNKVTYVIRSRYAGTPTELAWVIPLPATPTDVVAHPNAALFEALDRSTAPVFIIGYAGPQRVGCGCAGAPGLASNGGGDTTGLVTVEARGTAGVFDWAALTSSGSAALLAWLNDNGFAVSSLAAGVIDNYIQQDAHFLALHVDKPQTLSSGQGDVEIPPIQFTCRTDRYFYPMTISQISAAQTTEVVVYTLAAHRLEADNLPNAAIEADKLVYRADSPSQTNYERLFTQAGAQPGGPALVTECVTPTDGLSFWGPADWPAAPPGVLDLPVLTRMRTVIARDQMNQDFEFRAAKHDTPVDRTFYVTRTSLASAAGVFGQPSAALMVYGAFHIAMKRRTRRISTSKK
jgi:hypothetical protein